MDSEFEWSVEETPPLSDLQALDDGLSAENDAAGVPRDQQRLCVFVRAAGRRVAGGLFGATCFGWLAIKHLWVARDFRGSGIGSKLLRLAEDEARRRGCRFAQVDTFSFQALPFYQRLGYEIFGVLEDYPPGHQRYYLKKTLAGGTDAR